MADTGYQLFFVGEAVDEEFYDDIVSLTVEENTGAATTLQLRLSTRILEDGSWSYLEDERLALLTEVRFKVGFLAGGGLAAALGGLLGSGGNDGLSTVFTGYVTNVSLALDSLPGNTFIDLTAIDTSVLLSFEEKMETWTDLSDGDIIQQILATYGLHAQVDSTPTVHQENDRTIVQRGSDLSFIRGLAQRNGLELYFETDAASGEVVAYCRAPQLEGTPQPDLAIHFGEASNLRNFSARISAQRPLNVKAQQVDVKSNSGVSAQAGQTQRVLLGASDLNSVVGGPVGSLVAAREAPAQMLVLGSPTSDATELQTIVQAVRDEAGWFIAASGEVNTVAYGSVLRPHRLVLVKGAGSPFSGKYYVTQVTHEIKADGSYTQRFEARRNARDLDGSEEFGGSDAGLPLPGV